MHGTEFLRQPPAEIPAIVVLSGGQRHLKTSVLQQLRTAAIGDDESSLSRFTGKDVDLQTITDELRTVSMWGDRRLVQIDDAEDFVTKNRAGLEKYAEKPSKKAVLVLDVKSWPKNTRLAKQLAKTNSEIECSKLEGAALVKWLQETARTAYGKTLAREAGPLLIELVGEDLGLFDQELSKLASYIGEREKIEEADVRTLVGDWRTETTWAMTDAARDGDLNAAFAALGQLLTAGEAAPKLVGGINYVFRKYAHGTENSRRMPLDEGLRAAGVFPRDVGIVTGYLKRIGRAKAERILGRLLATDSGLKGGSRLPDRMQLELLLLQLSGRGD
ncbi:MAG TPA: DNA polymerase III subunit delta [Planctomycetaceae bacterium]|nr:DNA polymerase III subunit delta [Planctomycetaceae bacterium]